ncbi:MAG: carbohydrate ABC transporter permease [Caldicoprobacterales bacterium]
MKNNKFVFAVLFPIFALITIFLVVPLVYGLAISFFDYNPLRQVNPFIGLSNYSKLFQDELFYKATTNTLFFVFVTVALNIMITLLLAQFITVLPSNKIRSFFRTMFFLPCVAPLVAASTVWGGNIYSTRYGILNTILSSFNLPRINFLGDASLVMYSLIVFTLWADFGYNTVLFSAGLDSIPTEFNDAGKIDGAGPVQRFLYITFPLLNRTFVFVTIMTLISHFQMFVQFMVLAQRGGPNNASTVLTLYVYKLGFINKDMGYASTVALVLFIMIMVITLIQRRLNRVDWGY